MPDSCLATPLDRRTERGLKAQRQDHWVRGSNPWRRTTSSTTDSPGTTPGLSPVCRPLGPWRRWETTV
jgi:hypothetical protein